MKSGPQFLPTPLADDRRVVAFFEGEAPRMSPEQWAAVVARRDEVDHVLSGAEVAAVLDAVRGDDLDA